MSHKMEVDNFARMLAGMRYGALRRVAADLAGMCEDTEIRPQLKTAEEFAELLNDWAESHIEEIEMRRDA